MGSAPNVLDDSALSDYTRPAMTDSEAEFETVALAALEACLEAAENAEGLEADLEGGVLTVRAPGGKTWLLNKHAPMRQLWLSSPESGASHYGIGPDGREWRDTRGGPPLGERWARELGAAVGRPIAVPT